MFTFNSPYVPEQIPLIHVVDNDDQHLLNSPDAEWYRILHFFPWEDYRELAALYYDALYEFNKSRAKEPTSSEKNTETRPEATQRLLFERSTINENAPVVAHTEEKQPDNVTVAIDDIAPGKTPIRLCGKRPKCFFALFKSFIGATLMGFAPEPQFVYALLTSNLSFARVCGFIPKGEQDQYWHRHVPSIRKLEQFDQIMTDYGIWHNTKWMEVRKNIESRVVEKEQELVGDTTHYHAFSGFETISYNDENGQEKRKSQSKLTKNCRCDDKEQCPHPWELADDGAGTIVKAHNKYIWGHKASILGLPRQGIPLDAIAVTDAAKHDGQTLYPHVLSLFEHLPEVKPWINTVLYDSACDDEELKALFEEQLEISLRTSLNPRRKQPVTNGLPKGMAKITPYGNVVCDAGIEMDYKGIRYRLEKFIYQAPLDQNGLSVCAGCEKKPQCCPRAENGRIINVPFEMLSNINPGDPPMAKRFKAMMKRRPSVERMIKRLKCDLSDDRLKKRGNASFQAYLDKTMIAFHILLRN